MTAGQSAQSVAGSAAAVASWATRRASAFDKGAIGERSLAAEVAPLSADGWVMLHDRRSPNGGNVDHVLVGPGGVVVLDAKAWNGALTVTPSKKLRCGQRNKHDSVTAMADHISMVQKALPQVPVSGGLVFIDNESSDTLPARLDGVGLCSLERVLNVLRRKPHCLDAAGVDAAVATLTTLFPAMGAVRLVRPEPVERVRLDREAVQAIWDNPISERYRFYVARAWSRYGRSRTYLNDQDGHPFGWIDNTTRKVQCDSANVNDTTAILLRLVEPTSLPDPDITVISPAGRLTARILRSIGNSHRGVGHVVAHVWTKGDKRRLYVTLHVRGMAPIKVGDVDLKTGRLNGNDPALAGLLQHTLHVVFDAVVGTEGSAGEPRVKP